MRAVILLKCEKDFQEAVREYQGGILKLSIDEIPLTATSTRSSTPVVATPVVVDITRTDCYETEDNEAESNDGDLLEPAAKQRKLGQAAFDEMCKMLSHSHQNLYGVECLFEVLVQNGASVIHCPVCSCDIKPQKGRPGSLQPFEEHMKRGSHRANVLSLCNREGLQGENFDNVELREIAARRLLKVKAPGVFEVKKREDGLLVAECKFCGPSKQMKLLPKSSSLEANISSHINGKPHVTAAKYGTQCRISSFMTSSTTNINKSGDHS